MPNATICSADSVVFRLVPGYSSFDIFPKTYVAATSNASQIVVKPQVSTTYVFYLQKSTGCGLSDTSVITLRPVNSINLGNDTVICKGQSLTLNATNPSYTRYQWSTGSTGSQITISDKGSYWIHTTDKNGCAYADTIELKDIHGLQALSLSSDSVLCSGKTLLLTAPAGMLKVVWQDGSTNNSFLVAKPGKYWVTVTDSSQCKNSDTATIIRTINAPGRFLTTDSSICRFDTVTLKSSIAFEKYFWNDGTVLPTLIVNSAGNYSLTVTDRFHCDWNQKVAVTVEDCSYTIFFPNAFSPNRDGLNDVFRAKSYGRPQSFHIDIYNRWGQKIFSSDDYLKGWDGTINKVPQGQDTYVWIAQYRFPGQTTKTEKGTVVLIR